MFSDLRPSRSPQREPGQRAPWSIRRELPGALAIGLSAIIVCTIGTTSRTLLSGSAPESTAQTRADGIVIQTTGAFLTTNDSWFDQLNNPSAWRGGQFRERRRAMSREEERREREMEERETRERRARQEREEREERLREAREEREEAWGRARAIGRERGTYRTVCVRLCDGYFFPISFATTPDRFAADEAACNSRCSSGARLYVYPNPGGEPEDMRDVRGQPYMALKNAFLFRTSYVEACTCKPHPWEREALDRHRLYAERTQKSKRAVAAKVQPAQRDVVQVREPTEKHSELGPRSVDVATSDPAAEPQTVTEDAPVSPAPAASTPAATEGPRRPAGAMLLGVAQTKPPRKRASRTRSAERASPRERRQTSNERSSSGRPAWASRVFGGTY